MAKGTSRAKATSKQTTEPVGLAIVEYAGLKTSGRQSLS